ncbi:hypothetical protein [Spirillospora sp. NPDC029432]|uniref:hypothetical protein n=1 Tax=Spirillospora sp. NPDC029432 TaxID=3154599 RepID=UPI003451DA64
MRFDVAQIVGVALLVLGAQGAIRQLVDRDDAGILSGLPGGAPATLTVYIAAVVIGVPLAGWAHQRAKTLKRRR